jgi:Zn-dependent metalloprotease
MSMRSAGLPAFPPLAVLGLTLLGTSPAFSAESPLAAANRLRAATGGNVVVRYSMATGVARFVRATGDATVPLSSPPSSLEDKAYRFFEQYGAVFGVTAPRQQLTVSRVSSDETGSDVRLGQRHNGLPVFNAQLVVHFDTAGAITAVNGAFLPGLKVSLQPVLGAADAAVAAVTAVASAHRVDAATLTASSPVLGVTKVGLARDAAGPQALAWSSTVAGPALRQFVFVDAIHGGVIEMFEGVPTDRRRENYNMLEQSDYDLAVPCRFEGDPPSGEPDCDNAFVFSGDTYNFYWNGFRRDSVDNLGLPLKSYVHFFSTICPNAYWNGQFMTYCSTFPHDDVAGHEITHGVTEFSANLVYAYQPGALNESFSDIFGETIDLLNDSENEPGSRWQIGEGIIGLGPIRDMSDPTLFGDPDATDSPNYGCSASDNGGVHSNSGVPNKAYSLMVDGGTHNAIVVNGIGLTRAAAIEYRALTRYLGTYSNFADTNEALLASCRDLRNKRLRDPDPETGGGFSSARISNADCAQVKKALDAVRMSGPVCAGAGPQPAPALCSAGAPVRLFFDDHETGSPGWTESVDTARYAAQHWARVSDFTFSGASAWRVNDALTSCSSGDWASDVYLVSPPVNLAGATNPTLRFVHDFFTEGGYDGGTIEINLNGTWTKLEQSDFTLNPYNGQMSLDSTAPNWTPTSRNVFTGYRTPGSFPNLKYSESRAALGGYLARDTDKVVQFRFRFGTDVCNGTDIGWYMDDVEVYECR